MNYVAYYGNKYLEYLNKKVRKHSPTGFNVDIEILNPMLFSWQKACVQWALRQGRAALFQGCGLGKTPQQLEWARHVSRHTGGDVLIVAPLAVSQQTIREGRKFGIEVHPVRSQADVKTGINVTNYEMVHHFDTDGLAGVVLDESSILKAVTGKMRGFLIEKFSSVPYRLCCTATPAPNDHTELGNHAEFLGISRHQEMLSRWFVNDSYKVGNWRLKHHAQRMFWEWVSSWAVCMGKPSDIGYTDDGFILPPLKTVKHIVKCESGPQNGMLFRVQNPSATDLRREMRESIVPRARKAAEIVNEIPDSVLLWCNTNAEADRLKREIPEAHEVRGSMAPEHKERALRDFSEGRTRVLITKPSIAGFGLNWQHCNQMIFVGLSYSFEERYQAIRRCWRFGQEREVFDHVVMGEAEVGVFQEVQKKEKKHVEMENQTSRYINAISTLNVQGKFREYAAEHEMKLPEFLTRGEEVNTDAV